jgi:hypothetical protein
VVNAYLKTVWIPSFKAYGLFVGMGNLCICDGWFLELSDLKLFDIDDEGLIEERLFADGVLLFKSREPLEKIADMIEKKYPNGFCLGCLRSLWRSRKH